VTTAQSNDLLADPAPFDGFKILTKTEGMIDLVPNWQQCRLITAVGMQQGLGLPIRILILKFRQGGFSTAVEAIIFKHCDTIPYKRGFVCAHDEDSSETLFRMTKLYYDEQPPGRRKPTDYSSKKEIMWSAPHRSLMQVQTAGKVSLGRSKTIDYLHCSEVAWWKTAKQSLLSVMQCIPDSPDSMVFLETTANGVGGEFYDMWQDAVQARHDNPNDLSGFLPLFFSWLDYPQYSTPLPEGMTLDPLDEEEEELVELGANAEQLWWRRRTIADKCGGDVSTFKQEYPSNAGEAFQMSGRGAISAKILTHHRRTATSRADPQRARFKLDPLQPSGVTIEINNDFDGMYWDIWKTVEERHDYTVGGDTMEGQLSDPSDEDSEADFNAALVLDRHRLEYVALCHNQVDPDLFGLEMLKAAMYYNNAWATPEANSSGLAALLEFKRANYARTYRRLGNDENIALKEAGKLGWKTMSHNRDMLIDNYLAACRADPVNGWEFSLVVPILQLVEQEERFYIDKMGKRRHRSGAHDDILFAAMICWELHLRCPRTMGHTSLTRRTDVAATDYRYAGGYDHGIEEFEDAGGVERTR